MKTILKSLLSLVLVFVSILTIQSLFNVPDSPYIWSVFVFTAPGGIGANFAFNLQYLPEVIHYNDAAAPLNFLRVETKDRGTIHDWTAAGIAALNGFMKPGVQAANDVNLMIANGHLDNKTVTITGQTSAVGAINIFVGSDNKGTAALRTANANILANSPTTFTKFTALFLPTLVTLTDRVEVVYDDGHSETWDAAELAAMSTNYQQVPGIIVNNIGGSIRKVIVTSVIGLPAYVLSVDIPGQS